jgi:hypothetical protein
MAVTESLRVDPGVWQNESEAAPVRQHQAASDPPSSAKTWKGADEHDAIGL